MQLQAAEILAIFRECGWIKPRQIGRSGEYVVNLSTDCRRMMDFLDKLTEKKTEGTMSNRILSMYEIMEIRIGRRLGAKRTTVFKHSGADDGK